LCLGILDTHLTKNKSEYTEGFVCAFLSHENISYLLRQVSGILVQINYNHYVE